jgi:hypothetical protein
VIWTFYFLGATGFLPTGTFGDLDFLGAKGTLGDLDFLGATGFLPTGTFGDLDFLGTTGVAVAIGCFVFSFFNLRAGSSGAPLVRLELFLSPKVSSARHRVKTIPKKNLIAIHA